MMENRKILNTSELDGFDKVHMPKITMLSPLIYYYYFYFFLCEVVSLLLVLILPPILRIVSLLLV